MNRPFPWAVAIVLASLSAGGGCDGAAQNQSRLDLAAARDQATRLEQANLSLRAQVASQQQQIQTLQALGGPDRLKKLFQVQRIQLGRHSGGVDLDGIAGDDGIRVYLRPIDQAGSVIKAAGAVKVQLFDLAAEEGETLVGQRTWTVDQLASEWAGGFLSYHFSLTCPWAAAATKSLPAHKQITVRVEFIDYLTGKTFSAQKLCTITPLAPAE